MKITSTVYQNRKGVVMVMVRLPMAIALKLGVGDDDAIGQLQQAIEESLNDRRGEGAAE